MEGKRFFIRSQQDVNKYIQSNSCSTSVINKSVDSYKRFFRPIFIFVEPYFFKYLLSFISSSFMVTLHGMLILLDSHLYMYRRPIQILQIKYGTNTIFSKKKSVQKISNFFDISTHNKLFINDEMVKFSISPFGYLNFHSHLRMIRMIFTYRQLYNILFNEQYLEHFHYNYATALAIHIYFIRPSNLWHLWKWTNQPIATRWFP